MKNKFLLKIVLIALLLFLLFLRFYKLASLISPYWEEVAIGYDAYSIFKTARDHHGNFLPIIAFESFGDFKPALYFYLVVPFIKLISLRVLAIRLPAAIAGLLIILGNGFLALNIWQLIKVKVQKKESRIIFLIALFLTALSPWAFMFSRAAWEVNLATVLIVWGVNFFFFFMSKKSFKMKLVFLLLAVISFLLSTYSYHGARVAAPLLGISLFLLYFYQQVFAKKQQLRVFLSKNYLFILSALIISVLGFWPILKNINSAVVKQRAMEASIFYDLEIIKESNALIEQAGGGRLAKIRYHRYLLFSRDIIKNFFDHFNFKYLFISGDNNPRHSTQFFGNFYILDLLLFIFAIVFLIKNFSIYSLFIVIYFIIGILPAAISKASPHALRTLLALPAFITLLTFGVWQIKEILSKKFNFIFIIFVLSYLYLAASFFKFYFYQYPQLYQKEWQYGYQELMLKLEGLNDGETPIYISREWGRPAMYYWFYSQTKPEEVQAWNNFATKDQGEYLEFKNFNFINDVGEIDTNSGLLAASDKTIANFLKHKSNYKIELIAEFADAQGELVWQIYAFNF